MKRGEKDEYSLACVVSKGAKQYGKDPQIDSCLNGNTEYCNFKNQFKKKKNIPVLALVCVSRPVILKSIRDPSCTCIVEALCLKKLSFTVDGLHTGWYLYGDNTHTKQMSAM